MLLSLIVTYYWYAQLSGRDSTAPPKLITELTCCWLPRDNVNVRTLADTDRLYQTFVELYVNTQSADTHIHTALVVFTLTPVCVVSSEKCLTNYMPIMFGMSAFASPGSNAVMRAHTHHISASLSTRVSTYLSSDNFDLFCYTCCKSLRVSVSAPCLKCLTSW